MAARLIVQNMRFTGGMDMSTPVYLTQDTFRGNHCSNGGAVSGLYANFIVINSLLTGNQATGWGQNPAQPGTPGGGSGGAIFDSLNGHDVQAVVIDSAIS